MRARLSRDERASRWEKRRPAYRAILDGICRGRERRARRAADVPPEYLAAATRRRRRGSPKTRSSRSWRCSTRCRAVRRSFEADVRHARRHDAAGDVRLSGRARLGMGRTRHRRPASRVLPIPGADVFDCGQIAKRASESHEAPSRHERPGDQDRNQIVCVSETLRPVLATCLTQRRSRRAWQQQLGGCRHAHGDRRSAGCQRHAPRDQRAEHLVSRVDRGARRGSRRADDDERRDAAGPAEHRRRQQRLTSRGDSPTRAATGATSSSSSPIRATPDHYLTPAGPQAFTRAVSDEPIATPDGRAQPFDVRWTIWGPDRAAAIIAAAISRSAGSRTMPTCSRATSRRPSTRARSTRR